MPIRQAAEKRNVATPLHLRPCFGFDWKDLSSYAGPAALAVCPLTGAKSDLPGSFQPRNGRDKLFAAGRAYFRHRGYEETADALGAAKLAVFKPPAGGGRSDSPTYLMSETVAVAASSRATAVAIWEQFNGKAKISLGSLKDFSDLAGDGPKARIQFIAALVVASDWSCGRLCGVMQSRLQAPTGWPSRGRQGGQADSRDGRPDRVSQHRADRLRSARTGVGEPAVDRGREVARLLGGAPPAIPEWLDGNVASVSLWGCNVPEAVTAFGHVFDELNEPGPAGRGHLSGNAGRPAR